jgi:hypothetical protein
MDGLAFVFLICGYGEYITGAATARVGRALWPETAVLSRQERRH